MAFRTSDSRLPGPGNLAGAERWMSILGGLGLAVLAARARGGLGRAAAGTAGLALLTRGAAGYCGMKAAASGNASLGEGMREQWQRMRSVVGRGAAQIDSLDSLYVAELQELHSAEAQLAPLVESVADAIENPTVRNHLRSYANELASRRQDVARILGSHGIDPGEHPDQAMHALIGETKKMAQVCGAGVRDAALVASLQRILHYKMAGYGTVAAYAKALGRVDEAARFAEYTDRDEAVDAELSDLAKSTLNPEASVQPQGQARQPAEAQRPH